MTHDVSAATRRGPGHVAAWVLYDFGYGAFNTIVATFVIPAYFTQAVAANPASGSAEWAGAQSAAGLLIALLAVPLGAVSDRGGRGRAMLAICTAIMVAATAGLWFVRPHGTDAARCLLLMATATVAFEIALIFYNSMLPGLCASWPHRLGRLSMLAWGAGYLGGLLSLGACLAVLVMPAHPPFGLDHAAAEPVRACALLAAVWVALFAWPVVVWAPAERDRLPWREAVRQGFSTLRPLVREVWADRPMRRFIVARLFYMDGLVTLFAFGGIYAAGQFGLDAKGVLLFGIGMNVTAGLGVLAGSVIEDRIGSHATILGSVLALAGLGLVLLFVHDPTLFWVCGLSLGLFVGPAQAASRSFVARLAPQERNCCYFGMLALSGRVTSFAGPMALAVVTAVTGSQRAGMGVIVVFLAAGAWLLRGIAPTTGRVRPAVPETSPLPASRLARPKPPAGSPA